MLKQKKLKNKQKKHQQIQRIKKIHLKGKKIYPSFNMIETTMTDKTVNARFFLPDFLKYKLQFYYFSSNFMSGIFVL